MSTAELLASISKAVDSPVDVSENERLQLVAACESLQKKLETPREGFMKIFFSCAEVIALRLASDMKLFDAAVSLSSNRSEIQLEELAAEINAEPFFVLRIMRFLICMKFFEELGYGRFKVLPRSSHFVSDSVMCQGILHMTFMCENMYALPKYFENTGYKSPTDAYNSPFQYFKKTDLHPFDWLATQPREQHAFNIVMGMERSSDKLRWFDVFPVSSKLKAQDPSEPLVVDIGGNLGHDLTSFQQKFPDLTGGLVVEDIPAVIDSIQSLPTGIKAVKHDFFAPQPVKGAKVYLLGHVLHDWPDKQALSILKHIRDAMDSGSRLLICENVIPETNVSLYSACTDFAMMSFLSALERTQNQYRDLLERAGLELVGVWEPERKLAGSDTVLEATLKKS